MIEFTLSYAEIKMGLFITLLVLAIAFVVLGIHTVVLYRDIDAPKALKIIAALVILAIIYCMVSGILLLVDFHVLSSAQGHVT